MPEPTTRVLEINLISAQGLKQHSSNLRRMQTYAVAWVDQRTKLRTRIDQLGGENPTWNDKFLFRVNPKFLASETSAVSVAIYSVGCFKDQLIGTVRFLISNILSSGRDGGDAIKTPSFTALQIRRPSGRFHGVLNIGAMVLDGSGFPSMNRASAIGYHNLMGEKIQHSGKRDDLRRKSFPISKDGDETSSKSSGFCENSLSESGDISDGTESSTSSSSTVLGDWNGVREMVGSKGLKSPGLLCGLLTQRRIRTSSSNPNTSPEARNVER
ncbi:hypothetical protein L6164_003966 [Bauhinia variegata]|uniref:Uncharacterized protein n=1 Tax=Bauhinia variegata TaxID=167791 RepID=A0ACB9Q2Z9_BAUVA|nr:hypothetical protein L6164_003966 [Bauhinia variegata]